MGAVPLVGLDESFSHQLVAPRATTQYATPRWAERTYYLLHIDSELTMNVGRQLYRHDGRWSVFSAAATPVTQVSVRAAPSFSPGDNPDEPLVGPLRVEVIRPLEQIRLALDEPGFPLAYDLTFTARFPPFAHEPTLIERDGEVVTHTMSFFQSGLFSGVIRLDNREWQVNERAAFRDRSWGFRKHDGAPGRGLVLFAACELDDATLYVLIHERASGERAYTGGWLVGDGHVDAVVGAEHDLRFEENLLTSGILELEFQSGARGVLSCETENRLFLSEVGYSADPERTRPARTTVDLTQSAERTRLDGQIDHGCRFDLDGRSGHGYVETGLGTHARYRPPPAS